jgi:hypothetical protein
MRRLPAWRPGAGCGKCRATFRNATFRKATVCNAAFRSVEIGRPGLNRAAAPSAKGPWGAPGLSRTRGPCRRNAPNVR